MASKAVDYAHQAGKGLGAHRASTRNIEQGGTAGSTAGAEVRVGSAHAGGVECSGDMRMKSSSPSGPAHRPSQFVHVPTPSWGCMTGAVGVPSGMPCILCPE